METPYSPRISKRKFLLLESPHLKMFEGMEEYLSVSEIYYDGLIEELHRHEVFLASFMQIKEKLHGRGMGYDQYFNLVEMVWNQYIRMVRSEETDDWQTARITSLRLKHRWLIACGNLYISVFETYQTTKMTRSRLILARRLDELTDLMETALEEPIQASENDLASFDEEAFQDQMQRKILKIQ